MQNPQNLSEEQLLGYGMITERGVATQKRGGTGCPWRPRRGGEGTNHICERFQSQREEEETGEMKGFGACMTMERRESRECSVLRKNENIGGTVYEGLSWKDTALHGLGVGWSGSFCRPISCQGSLRYHLAHGHRCQGHTRFVRFITKIDVPYISPQFSSLPSHTLIVRYTGCITASYPRHDCRDLLDFAGEEKYEVDLFKLYLAITKRGEAIFFVTGCMDGFYTTERHRQGFHQQNVVRRRFCL